MCYLQGVDNLSNRQNKVPACMLHQVLFSQWRLYYTPMHVISFHVLAQVRAVAGGVFYFLWSHWQSLEGLGRFGEAWGMVGACYGEIGGMGWLGECLGMLRGVLGRFGEV